jgi:hypothetical protein
MIVATLRPDLRVVPCQTPRGMRRRMRAIMEKVHRYSNVSRAAEDLERVTDAVAAYPRGEPLSHDISEV